jgi:prophage DNA circulation protein
VLGQLLNSILQGLMDIFGNVPEATEEDRIRALAELISQMKQEIDVLQAEMDTVQSEVDVLQSQMGFVEQKTEYMNTYTDILLNEVTNFNSDITTTNGIFGETSRIGQNGAASFSSVKTSTINTPYSNLRINGNVTINGSLIFKNASTGNYTVSGGTWNF